jgi:hypothetical protein
MRPDALVMVDRHIVEARKHIADQIKRIRAMVRRGEDTKSSRELLATMKESLAVHEAHRENILDLLARDAGPTIHA